MSLNHIISQSRRRTVGPSLDLNFEIDKSNTSRVGPTPTFSRASSGTFVNKNGVIVGKTRSTSTINLNDYVVGNVLTFGVPSGSVVGWIVGSLVIVMSDTNADDIHNTVAITEHSIQGNILSYTDTTLTLIVTAKTGTVTLTTPWVSYRGLRIDHDPVTGACLGALLEDTRTNVFKYSSDFTASDWNNAGYRSLIPVPNAALSPAGIQDAQKLCVGSGLPTPQEVINQQYWQVIQATQIIKNNISYTYSGYLKAGEVTRVNVRVGSPSRIAMDHIFELTGDGSVVVNPYPTTSIVSIKRFRDGWYKFAITARGALVLGAEASTTARLLPVKSNATNSSWGTGNGTDGFYAWGLQFEEGTHASSYIPTTASSVIRAPDTHNIMGSSFASMYNQGEGTVFCQYSPHMTVNSSGFGIIGIHREQRSLGGITIGASAYFSDTSVRLSITAYTSPPIFTNQAKFEPIISNSKVIKTAFAVRANDFAASSNGMDPPSIDTDGILDQNMTRLVLGSNGNTSNPQSGFMTIANFRYYPRRLSNSQLQMLSTSVTEELLLGGEPITYINNTDTVTITI